MQEAGAARLGAGGISKGRVSAQQSQQSLGIEYAFEARLRAVLESMTALQTDLSPDGEVGRLVSAFLQARGNLRIRVRLAKHERQRHTHTLSSCKSRDSLEHGMCSAIFGCAPGQKDMEYCDVCQCHCKDALVGPVERVQQLEVWLSLQSTLKSFVDGIQCRGRGRRPACRAGIGNGAPARLPLALFDQPVTVRVFAPVEIVGTESPRQVGKAPKQRILQSWLTSVVG